MIRRAAYPSIGAVRLRSAVAPTTSMILFAISARREWRAGGRHTSGMPSIACTLAAGRQVRTGAGRRRRSHCTVSEFAHRGDRTGIRLVRERDDDAIEVSLGARPVPDLRECRKRQTADVGPKGPGVDRRGSQRSRCRTRGAARAFALPTGQHPRHLRLPHAERSCDVRFTSIRQAVRPVATSTQASAQNVTNRESCGSASPVAQATTRTTHVPIVTTLTTPNSSSGVLWPTRRSSKS